MSLMVVEGNWETYGSFLDFPKLKDSLGDLNGSKTE